MMYNPIEQEVLENCVFIGGRAVHRDRKTLKKSDAPVSSKPQPQEKKIVPTPEESYEVVEVYCIHDVKHDGKKCDIEQNMNLCASCPYRKSSTIRIPIPKEK